MLADFRSFLLFYRLLRDCYFVLHWIALLQNSIQPLESHDKKGNLKKLSEIAFESILYVWECTYFLYKTNAWSLPFFCCTSFYSFVYFLGFFKNSGTHLHTMTCSSCPLFQKKNFVKCSVYGQDVVEKYIKMPLNKMVLYYNSFQ